MDLIVVDSREYRQRFSNRLIERGYDQFSAKYTMKKWEESTEESASPESDPERDADDCFDYWEEHCE